MVKRIPKTPVLGLVRLGLSTRLYRRLGCVRGIIGRMGRFRGVSVIVGLLRGSFGYVAYPLLLVRLVGRGKWAK
jgi:hypothetical protein